VRALGRACRQAGGVLLLAGSLDSIADCLPPQIFVRQMGWNG